ncbi:MAG TPA: glycoside hydrolase family 3 N-terminal domain-containing protein [Gemmatimonadales bacterium]|nr:glycoside hydrolase family 3 N-terminal domain-containing protein [Gemmatimonadales bacterium]
MPLARLLMPALRWQPESGFDHESPLIEQALALGVGGFIMFGGPAEDVQRLTSRLASRASRPLLLAADLERGAGQQFAGLQELPPPRALGFLDDLDAVRRAGATTAHDALSVGLNWVFAPVADLDAEPDNPIIQTRAFGDDPAWVGACVAAWVEGCQGAGALACVKHFPGHGRTVTDSHAGLPLVPATRAELEDDLRPFRAGIRAGVAACMTAHVSFPALDPRGLPATVSPDILGMLRSGLGFTGAVVSDALIMEGAFEGRAEANACVEAVAAGVDILLYPRNLGVACDALREAEQTGGLAPERIKAALTRVNALAELQQRLALAASSDRMLGVGTSLADRLLAAPPLRGIIPMLRQPLNVAIVDDDQGGPYPASPGDWIIRALEDAGVAFGSGGSRIVIAYAEPRAWKGRAGFGTDATARLREFAPSADLILLFGHPRLGASMPGNAPILVGWHRQRLMQEAVARWLMPRVRR